MKINRKEAQICVNALLLLEGKRDNDILEVIDMGKSTVALALQQNRAEIRAVRLWLEHKLRDEPKATRRLPS